MKYWFFAAAIAGVPFLTVLLVFNRRWLCYTAAGLIVPVLFFNQSAINFYSHELYRGTSRGMEISVIYLIAAAMLLAMGILKGMRSPVPVWGVAFYLLYFLGTLPSFANAENRLFSFFESWKMIMMYLVFLAMFYYLKDTMDFETVLYTLAGVSFINFLVVVKQHFIGIHQAHGIFPHQNSMGMYLMVAGNLFFARFFNRAEPLKSWFYLLAFVCTTGALFRTYSRGSMICYPFSLMISMAVSVFYAFRVRMIRMVLLLSAIALAGLLLFLPRIAARFEHAPKSSWDMRRNFAVAAFNMIKDNPWAGVGLNNWGIKINPPYEYSEHRDPERGFTEDYRDGIVESIYLLTAAECGIPGLMLLLLWFGYYWLIAFRLLKFLRKGPWFFAAAGLLGGLTGAYIQSMVEWVLKQQINFNGLMIVFAMLSVLNSCRKELEKKYRTEPPGQPVQHREALP